FRIKLARAAALELEQTANRGGDVAAGEIVDGAAGGAEILERQIDATSTQIVLDVAHDVGELERDAEIQRVIAGGIARAAEDLDANQTDRGGYAPAILEQIRERLVSVPVEIHRHAVDYVREGLPRQVERRDEGLKAAALCGSGRRTVITARQLGPPELDRLGARPLLRFVHRIVDGATEVPDGDDRVTLRAR